MRIAALRLTVPPPMERGERHTLPGKLVVSLTSHPPRFCTLDITLRYLLSQDVQPDVLVLWLARGDAGRLPPRVKALIQHGLNIRECDDLKSFNKIVPSLLAYPNAFIVTADDDMRYPRGWLRRFVEEYRDPREILCQRGRRVILANGTFAPYRQWPSVREDGASGPTIFPMGTGGVMYPPGALPEMTTNAAQFMRLCPHADDIWLYWMGLRSGCAARLVAPAEKAVELPTAKLASLVKKYNGDGGNDRQIAAMVTAYGLPQLIRN